MRNIWYALVLSVCALLGAPALAADAGTFDDAFALYLRASERDAAATEKANDAFRALSEQAPDNPVYLAYQGSTRVMKARDAWAPWSKLRHAEAGLEQLDRSLRLLQPAHNRAIINALPASVHVRSIAAITFISVPSTFRRFDLGRQMLQALIADPLLAPVPGPAKAHLYYHAAHAAEMDGDTAAAQTLYRSAINLAPEGRFAARAKTALTQLPAETAR